jgi:uncharacterized coiled-coil protein SlyX
MAMVSATQSSRGGLLTTAVISSAIALTCIVLCIYFYVESNKSAVELGKVRQRYGNLIAEAQLASGDISDLESLRNEDKLGFNPQMKAFDVLLKQRDDLAGAVNGSGSKWIDAMRAAQKGREDAEKKVVGPDLPALPKDLTGTINTLASKVVAQQSQVQQLQDQLAAATKQVEDLNNQSAAARAAMDQQIAAVREEAAKEKTEVETYRGTKDASIAQLQTDFDAKSKQYDDQIAQLNVQIQDLNKQVEKFRTQNQNLLSKTASNRVNTADAVVRSADGQIIRVVNNTTVYIDLGAGDQIAPGLTFQVYDRVEGVPPIGDNTADENLPRGKAAIEVVRVSAGSAECRVIRTQPGYNIIEGDLISNLVYDRNTKYTFMVYGNFDLDQNNVPTPGDTEVIKRLVTQWGAKLADRITVNTDFVVLGAEPQIPSFTKEELDDPINAAKDAEARAALDAYNQVLGQARELNIPVLNQNRFLYYVGYFEQSKR